MIGSNIIHALIELATDNELYTILRMNQKYNEGHPNLKSYKEVLYPAWFNYLKLNNEVIIKRIPKIGQNKYLFDELNKLKEINQSANIFELVDLCINRYISKME